MFHGTVPPDVQIIINSIIKDWDCKDIYVGYSGNFTIEKNLVPWEKFFIHSNDVTLYSYCLGNYLAGKDFQISLSDSGIKKVPWLSEYIKTPIDSLATVMLMSGIANYMDRGDNPYYIRMYNAYEKQNVES